MTEYIMLNNEGKLDRLNIYYYIAFFYFNSELYFTLIKDYLDHVLDLDIEIEI